MNKISNIKKYIETEDYDDFNNLDENIVFWVDWREEDDAIVKYCEKCLNTKSLYAKMNYEGEDLFLTIQYKNQSYKEEVIDRDSTLKFLNRVIQDDYEIRFCKASNGNDTLAFLPLSIEEWKNLEKDFSKVKLENLFEIINKDTQMFSVEWDFDFE